MQSISNPNLRSQYETLYAADIAWLNQQSYPTIQNLAKTRAISVSADKKAAFLICNSKDPRIPKSVAVAVFVINWMSLLAILGGIASFFYFKWHDSVPIIVIGFYLNHFVQNMAGRDVVDLALTNEAFFNDAWQNKVLYIYRSDK